MCVDLKHASYMSVFVDIINDSRIERFRAGLQNSCFEENNAIGLEKGP
jgi:hypothetical protein